MRNHAKIVQERSYRYFHDPDSFEIYEQWSPMGGTFPEGDILQLFYNEGSL